MDDANIVQLYWDRNEQAIPATADKYGSYCTSIAKNILGNNEDAEECVNDTYLNAWNSMPPHRPSILSTFLGKIVRNLSFNRYKHNNADKRGGGELPVVLEDCVRDVGDDHVCVGHGLIHTLLHVHGDDVHDCEFLLLYVCCGFSQQLLHLVP